ncbi:MAG: ribokinase [Gammaproteobacteria bacterium]|nr:ribokinase [Gammaproteobacteria bacterium]MDH5501763.1 ribokinase [Gammaproteobacteria bacterium]
MLGRDIKVIVVGSVNLDIVATVDRLPRAGETVTGGSLARYPGGKGANQALAARRLGASVQLVACTGDDSAADEALQLLREGGVDLSLSIRDPGSATGVALISVAKSGENQIVVAPGANRSLKPQHLKLPDADALICQLEVPPETLCHAARKFHGFFCINLAPAQNVPRELIERADLIVMNETEAAWYGSAVDHCRGLVVITRGEHAAVILKDGLVIAEAKPPAVHAVDTVGAGDCFTAALTLSLVEGRTPADALGFACAAGAAATTMRGAQPSMPDRATVERLL